MCLDRLRYYLRGGRPSGAGHTYPGCRDAADPRADESVTLPGSTYFALESPTWTGGLALYDPDTAGEAVARAYLVTASQFADIAAQEMHRAPGTDLDLTEVLASGRCALGPGRYETLVRAGERDGVPLLTFTAPWRLADVPGNRPAPAYVRQLSRGLAETTGWDDAAVAGYLSRCPGAGDWTPEEVAALRRVEP
ncbi:MAG: histone deacetylase [Streptosporangiales bacterium]|nr:histone deacetylase [Streptosporangiales bacterium]